MDLSRSCRRYASGDTKVLTILPSSDYDAEVAFVIGKGGKDISTDRWQEYAAGNTIMIDVSARHSNVYLSMVVGNNPTVS